MNMCGDYIVIRVGRLRTGNVDIINGGIERHCGLRRVEEKSRGAKGGRPRGARGCGRRGGWILLRVCQVDYE